MEYLIVPTYDMYVTKYPPISVIRYADKGRDFNRHLLPAAHHWICMNSWGIDSVPMHFVIPTEYHRK